MEFQSPLLGTGDAEKGLIPLYSPMYFPKNLFSREKGKKGIFTPEFLTLA